MLPIARSPLLPLPEGIKQRLAAWLPAKIPPLKLQIKCHLLDHSCQSWELQKQIINVNCSRLHKRKPRPKLVQPHSWAVKMRFGNQVSWPGGGGRETCHRHPPGGWLPQESSLFLLLPEHQVPTHTLQTPLHSRWPWILCPYSSSPDPQRSKSCLTHYVIPVPSQACTEWAFTGL